MSVDHIQPERGSTAHYTAATLRLTPCRKTPEERMVLNAPLPEVLGPVT